MFLLFLKSEVLSMGGGGMKPRSLTPRELMEERVAFKMEEVGGILSEADVRRIRVTLETLGNPPNLTKIEMTQKFRIAGLIVWPKELDEFATRTGYCFRENVF